MATARLTRSERTAQTRRELLDAAQRRFFRDGYHRTTLDDIADEAGYTKGAVYSTFKSKGGLFLALFDEVVDARVEAIRRMLAPHDSAEGKIAALAAQPVDERSSRFLLLSIEFWAQAMNEPELRAGFAASYGRLRSKLAELAPPCAPLDGESWALTTIALSNGLSLERMIDPGGVPDDIMATVQRGILSAGRGPAG